MILTVITFAPDDDEARAYMYYAYIRGGCMYTERRRGEVKRFWVLLFALFRFLLVVARSEREKECLTCAVIGRRESADKLKRTSVELWNAASDPFIKMKVSRGPRCIIFYKNAYTKCNL